MTENAPEPITLTYVASHTREVERVPGSSPGMDTVHYETWQYYPGAPELVLVARSVLEEMVDQINDYRRAARTESPDKAGYSRSTE